MFKFSDEFLKKLILGVFNGTITERELPENLYYSIADYLKSGLYKGFGIDFKDLTKQINQGFGKFIESDLELLTELRESLYMFSAAKTYQQVKEMTEALVNEKGTVVSYNEFKDKATAVFDTYNDNYLKTEYNTAIGQAIGAVHWNEIQKNKEVLPVLQYSCIGDACEICEPLDNLTAPVDDPIWDTIYPENHFNCKCIVIQLEEDTKLTPDDEKEETVATVSDRMIDEFKMNSGKDGYVFSPDHPYFSVPKGDVEFMQNNFNLRIPESDGGKVQNKLENELDLKKVIAEAILQATNKEVTVKVEQPDNKLIIDQFYNDSKDLSTSIIAASSAHSVSITNLIATQKEEHNNKLNEIVNSNQAAMVEIISKVKDLTKVETPQVTVNTNQDLIIKALEQLGGKLDGFFNEIKKLMPKETVALQYEHDIKRNASHLIEKIISTPKK
jgi:hypothetical protein